jgi:nucleotide-binding universal stress UspA family protein
MRRERSGPQVARSLAAAKAHGTVLAALPQQQRRLEGWVAHAEGTLREAGFSTKGLILAGDTREVLVQVAQSERADVLVVGSRGRTGITKLMLGSVSSHVVTHALLSVLVVKQSGRATGERTERVS